MRGNQESNFYIFLYVTIYNIAKMLKPSNLL